MPSFRKRRKYRKRKTYIPKESEKERMCLVKRLYDEYGTLERVGSVLRLTRERVRQILERGDKFQLFIYETTRDRKFKDSVHRISKEYLINQIRSVPNITEICSNLDISIKTFFRLIGLYNIDIDSHRRDVRFKKYMTKYSQMVSNLGYHPSTTVMQRNKEWRNIWAGITRLWGSMNKFRVEFGIQNPEFSLNANTLRAFREATEKRLAVKRTKVDKVYEIIKNYGPLTCRRISELTGCTHQNTYLYIKTMIAERKIEKIGKGNQTKYQI